MSAREQQINHIRVLLKRAYYQAEELHIMIYFAGCGADGCPLIKDMVIKLEAIKQQGREAVFDLMLHSTHRQFMRFLREHDQ